MARYDVDSRRRNAAGKIIGSHNGDAERFWAPEVGRHRSHDDGPPPSQQMRRKHTRRTLGATVRHQAQPPAQPHAPKHTVDVVMYTLNGMGVYITHARDAATALRALLHPEAVATRGVSIHGWIDGVQYSGAVPLAFVRQLLS